MTNYLIAGGLLLDATGAAPRPNTSVFVAGNRIDFIGPADEAAAYARQQGPHEVIDAAGMTVMPGMIDVHCHISYGDPTSAEALHIYTPVEYRTIKAVNNARKVLRAGVTSIVDPGSTWNIAVAIRNAIDAGLIEGPRMVSAGKYISTYNSIGSQFPTWIDHPPSTNSVLCNSRDEMVKEVRRQAKEGVDLIKVAGDGDVIRSSGFEEGSITLEELKAIAEMSHMLGKRCTIHSRSGKAAANAARAGFDWLIHCSIMTEEELGVIVDCGTPINPTLALLVNMIEWGSEFGASQAVIEGFTRELEAASKILSKAREAGVMMMSGTDSGQSSVPYGEWHARELECMMTYIGMSAMEAVQAATRNAAFAMNMSDSIGTLETGKLADLLVVDGNPLDDIQVLQDKARLKVIMKDGQVVDTVTPLPQPRQYRWERAQLYWSDREVATQEQVRARVANKPAWMR